MKQNRFPGRNAAERRCLVVPHSFLRGRGLKVGVAVIAAASCFGLVINLQAVRAQQAVVTGQTLYSQGDPADGEQYLLQLLNRARRDPVGEGQRLADWLRNTPDGQGVVDYYGVNPDQVASEVAAYPPTPPLAFDPDLLASSGSHSQDIANHGGVGPNGDLHAGYDGSTPASRVQASGYPQTSGYPREYGGENAASGMDSLDTVHASYLVDWGVPSLVHRKLSLTINGVNGIGMGVSTLSNSKLVDTEDYGGPKLAVSDRGELSFADVPALLTGVVYNDDNNNGQYDPGEGIAGVTVSMDGGKYYAVTSASGGYALPLVNAADGSNTDGTAQVHMIFADGGTYSATLSIDHYQGNFGSYRGNVEWDATAADDQLSPDPDLPYFGGGKAVTLHAGGAVKLKLFRPADSDLAQPYTVSYKVKGSAVAGVNYLALPATITVPAGESKVKVKVATLTGGTSATTLKLKLRGVSYRGTKTVTITP